MEVKLTQGQAKILEQLAAQHQAVQRQLDTVVATIAAGADIERWGGHPHLDLVAGTLTFAPPEDEQEKAA